MCVAFVESDDTAFWPGCIKSHFLHAFIVVKTNHKRQPEPGQPRRYHVSVVCRDEVSAFKPYLWHESSFDAGSRFRHWLLAKIINGERASYSAPKFARMQDRTRTQMLEDIVNNLANHLQTGQIPKPYRRGSWRPIGHMRPSSPLLDSVRDLFEGYDQLSKDFATAFNMNAKMICDVVFNVTRCDRPSTIGAPLRSSSAASGNDVDGVSGESSTGRGEETNSSAGEKTGGSPNVQFADTAGQDHEHEKMSVKANIGGLGCPHCHAPAGMICVCAKEDSGPGRRIFGVRAILAIRSRLFLEMLYGFSTVGSAQNSCIAQANQPMAAFPAGSTGRGGMQPSGMSDHMQSAPQNKITDVAPENKKQQSVSSCFQFFRIHFETLIIPGKSIFKFDRMQSTLETIRH